jgi:predicted membrane GTPase involved in stress response
MTTPLAGHIQPPADTSAAGTFVTVVLLPLDAVVVVVCATAGVVPTTRRVTVVLLDEDGLETTVVLPEEPLLKRMVWPG